MSDDGNEDAIDDIYCPRIEEGDEEEEEIPRNYQEEENQENGEERNYEEDEQEELLKQQGNSFEQIFASFYGQIEIKLNEKFTRLTELSNEQAELGYEINQIVEEISFDQRELDSRQVKAINCLENLRTNIISASSK